MGEEVIEVAPTAKPTNEHIAEMLTRVLREMREVEKTQDQLVADLRSRASSSGPETLRGGWWRSVTVDRSDLPIRACADEKALRQQLDSDYVQRYGATDEQLVLIGYCTSEDRRYAPRPAQPLSGDTLAVLVRARQPQEPSVATAEPVSHTSRVWPP